MLNIFRFVMICFQGLTNSQSVALSNVGNSTAAFYVDIKSETMKASIVALDFFFLKAFCYFSSSFYIRSIRGLKSPLSLQGL